jgi:hypothetical protein
MRGSTRGAWLVCLAAAGACTQEIRNPPDAQTGNHPPPRVIAGGGIGDGAIDGVVNLYVIDDQTRKPIPGATVRIGAVDGTTDASGLFVAHDLTGPQTVIARSTGYRSELWIGANGANLTVDLQPSVAPVPGRASLSGQITGFASIPVAAGHAKIATVAYAQTDDLGDPANSLTTPGGANTCVVTSQAAGCPFQVTARSGATGLIAAIFDRDSKGTADPADDTMTLVRWAYRAGIAVADGVDQTGQDLALIDPGSMVSTAIDFGTPPAGLPDVGAIVGIEAGTGAVYQLPAFLAPGAAAMSVPSLAALGGTGYRLTAVAQDAASPTAPQSIVLHRRATGATLATGAWLVPPTGVALTRTRASWTAAPGATVVGIEYTEGTATVTHLLDITVFDATTSVAIPDLVALPVAGTLDAKLNAIGATGLDLSSFALDADRDKLDRVAAVPVTVVN